jgi:hypothetical protein
MSLSICLVELLYQCFIVYYAIINPTMPLADFYLAYNSITDIYSSINPYLLIICSHQIKRKSSTPIEPLKLLALIVQIAGTGLLTLEATRCDNRNPDTIPYHKNSRELASMRK